MQPCRMFQQTTAYIVYIVFRFGFDLTCNELLHSDEDHFSTTNFDMVEVFHITHKVEPEWLLKIGLAIEHAFELNEPFLKPKCL
jgi:hypothetical protein